MASKVCGKRSGVAKQATIIPVVLNDDETGDFSIDSIVTAVQLVLADINARRSQELPQTPSALPKKKVMMMAINVETGLEDQNYIESLATALQAVVDLGVIIAVPAGNSAYKYGEALVAASYPTALAVSRLPSLIRVGVVDQSGIPPTWAQQGDIYACGVGVLCAKPNPFSFLENGSGSCASLAAFAGLVARGRSPLPYDSGDDIKQYQSIVKQYHVSGPGSWVRPGSNVRTVWNGLDGSTSIYCLLSLRKRDADVDDTCDDPCSTSSAAPAKYTPAQVAIVIYYSQQTSCSKSSRVQTFHIYSEPPRALPPLNCFAGLSQFAQSPGSSQAIGFQLLAGSGALDFTYSRARDTAGEVTAAPSPTPLQACKLSNRAVGPIDTTPVTQTFYEWATSVWYLP